ncbi:MAG TPA: PKD domain-containing protein, partial [Flavobacteriales bacterium]|nr:PKD domain-containing protein [Flavobacteriales bacterium]
MRSCASIVATLLMVHAMAQEIHEVSPVEISPFGENYAPVFLDSGFVMCSIRDIGGTVSFTEATTDKPLSDLFWVPFKEGKAGRPVLFSSNLSTPVNEGPAAFADNGTLVCFTRNQVLPKKLSNMSRANGQLGLFFSTLNNGIWSMPEAFAHNDAKFSIIHPTFSPDGNTLYFASDMPGGAGGMDLYACTRNGSSWSAPKSLGGGVNTSAHEVYPRVHFDGSMSFSSDRTGGQGKLDIYTSKPMGGGWSMPEALPAPVNGPENDHGYTLLPGGYEALFASNRGGTDAIYFDKRTVPKFRDCTEQQRNNYCYTFSRKPQPATSAIPVDHVWDMGDGTREKAYTSRHCYANPGNYIVRSLLVDRKSGDVFFQLGENALVVADLKQAWIASQDTVRTGRLLELDA